MNLDLANFETDEITNYMGTKTAETHSPRVPSQAYGVNAIQ